MLNFKSVRRQQLSIDMVADLFSFCLCNLDNMTMFWVSNGLLFIAAMLTMKHDPNGSARGVQLLSRPQTEEWKGWMQFAFIMVR
jgi:hypothetical protein